MARLPIQADGLVDYKQGTDTEVWVSPQVLTRANPSLQEFGAAIYALDVAGTTPLLKLGLDAATPIGLPERLPHGYRLKTADGQVFTVDASREAIDGATSTRFISAGATDLPIMLPTTTTLTTGAIAATRTAAAYNRYLTFYSCAEASFKADGDEINYRNFGEGVYDIGRKSKMKVTFDTMGFVTPGDTILNLVRRLAISTTESLSMLYIPPDDQALRFICDVKSDDRSSKVDAGYEAKFTYSLTKAPVNIDLTPS